MFPNVRYSILKWPQQPPLFFQIKFGEMLLTGGADPNIRTTTTAIPPDEPVINWSIRHGSLEVTKLLLRFGVELCDYGDDETPALHQCVLFGRTDHAEMLLAAGADPNIRGWDGNPPIFTALRHESIGIVKLLIKHTDDLSKMNKKGEGAIDALFGGEREGFNGYDKKAAQCLSFLLEEGLDIETHSHRGNKVIAAAAYARAYESVEVCIKAGSKLDAYTFSRETILTSLLRDCHPEVQNSPRIQKKLIYLIEMMIKAGADVNLNSRYGRTPLEVAISSCTVTGAWLLLQANCSVKITREVINFPMFMVRAVEEEAQSCAIFVFGDFCQTTKDQQVFFDISCEERTLENIEPLGLTRPPLSLARLCRLAVRAILPSGAAFSPAVDKLPLPRHVKDYVALRL